MATILILDDFPDYCDELAAALARDGNVLRTACTVQEAIDVGILLEPDVLITDWMLRDNVNGLDVAEVLRQVYPAMQTILMSGYSSSDLVEDARQFGVVDFLEKPFPLESVRKSLNKARMAARSKTPPAPIGVIETFSDGTIGHTNVVLEEMMRGTLPGAFAVKLDEYFSREDWQILQKYSLIEWVTVSPLSSTASEKRKIWHVRSKELRSSGVRVWAILDSVNVGLKNSAISLRLLGFAETPPEGLERCGHVLIVDANPSVRRLGAEMLRAMKLFCHAAEDGDAGIRIFAHDPDISHVIVDCQIAESHAEGFISRIKELRPQVIVIGSAPEADKWKCESQCADLFLAKPWDFAHLLEALRGMGGSALSDASTPTPKGGFGYLSF